MTQSIFLPSMPQPIAPTLPEEATRRLGQLGGLIALAEGAQRPFPLQSVTVRAAIAGDCCRTVIDQRFANPHDVGLEAVYLFPLPADGAVVDLELRAGEVTVRAECRERREAEAAFETARQAGHRAGLLTQERGDAFTVRVTNLPPQTEVTVRIVVVERLEHQDGRFHWRFPTVIAPRYLPGEPIGHAGPGVLPDTDRVPDASRLQPPLRLEGGTVLDLEVELEGPLTVLESSLHAVRLELGEGRVRVAPSGQATLDRDFVLAFSTAMPEATAMRAWTDGAHTLVVVEPPAAGLPEPMPRDAVFVIDVSGSMTGPKLDAAKRALAAALHGLLAGDRFMLLAFNNQVWPFAEDFAPYDDAALARADAWIAGLRASGGTEMLPAVRAALGGDTQGSRLRTVLLITDGEVWNDAELVAAVAEQRRGAYFFTMGIDTAVNAGLLRRLARMGGGTCELLTPADDIEAAVARFEARFGSPLVDELAITGGEPARDELPALFAGQPVSLLLDGAPATVAVTGRTRQGSFSTNAIPMQTSFALGALWARERTATLEDRLALRPDEEEPLRAQILRLALAHGIASRYTAFVAVDTSVTQTGERIEIVQPVELPLDWSEDFRMRLAHPALAVAMGAGQPGRRLLASQSLSAGAVYAIRQVKLLASDIGAAADVADDAPSVLAERPKALHESAPAVAPSVAPVPDRRAGIESELARTQGADGSFGGDVARTAAALLALVLLGHTRHRGARRRTVLKAAAWLDGHRPDARAALALDGLEQAEAGRTASALLEEWRALFPPSIDQADVERPMTLLSLLEQAGAEGAVLREAMGMVATGGVA